MDVSVGVGLFICFVVIIINVVAFKCNSDCEIERLKTRVEYFNELYHSLDKRWGNMYDVIKLQQEEIKTLKGMIEPKAEKKCCCGNCRFYYELNVQDSACLNVHVNNKLKGGSTLYSDNKPITWGTIKCVKPNECCEWYKPKEASDD